MKLALFGATVIGGAFAGAWSTSTASCAAAAAATKDSNAAAGYAGDNATSSLDYVAVHPSIAARKTADELRPWVKKREGFDFTFQPFVLGEVINLAEDVAIFRFLMHHPDDEFSLKPCSTLQASFKTGTAILEQPMRFYTPITPNGTKGYFDIIVKKYKGGRMTEHLFSLEVGESMLFRLVQYKLHYSANRWPRVGAICGGTGITPALQVIDAALRDKDDKTKLSLLFANRSESKILLKGLLDKLQRDNPDRFKVHYVVDKAENPEEWKGYTGHINEQMIRETMPPPGKGNLVLVCGPDKMMSSIVGAPFMVLKAMSGNNPWQPAASNLNNLSEVGGLLGRFNYAHEEVYRF